MDPISIGIIVTVLSLGTVLLFLFNADFVKNTTRVRTSSRSVGGETSNTNRRSKSKNSPNPTHSQLIKPNSTPVSSSIKKLPPTTSTTTAAAAASSNNSDTRLTKAQVETETGKRATTTSNHHNIPDLIVGHETKQLLKQQQPASSNRMLRKKETKPARLDDHVTAEFEPSPDELDSSIAMEIFNLSSARRIARGNKSLKQTTRHQSFESEEQENGNFKSSKRPTTPSYSSEQLLSMIAASNLSKDEVEFAVEMLLNKIDSGDSDWKKPKSDPIERLKNQLRENESALSVEIRNHEQTRARLIELKDQLHSERHLSNKSDDELVKLRKELSIANLALEQSRTDMSRAQSVFKQRDEESSKIISHVEQEKIQLQTRLLASSDSASRLGDYEALRTKFDETLVQMQRYELAKQKMNERIVELESKLRVADRLVDELRANKQHDDYEASAKISELKSDRIQLDKALKDQLVRFKEISEANNLLGRTMNELRVINARQDEMLKQMTDERQVHEISMKRTLHEMELELKELQQKLNANTIQSQEDKRVRQQRDLGLANHDITSSTGEQKLLSEMNQLREALAALFPDATLRSSSTDTQSNQPNDWVQGYLIALKQLSKTLDELDANNNNNNNSESSSPKKPSSPQTDKASTSPRKKTSSPISNGRSSRASTYHGHKNEDKKLQETKLLEALALFCLRCLD